MNLQPSIRSFWTWWWVGTSILFLCSHHHHPPQYYHYQQSFNGKTHPQWICERNQVELMRSTLKICLPARVLTVNPFVVNVVVCIALLKCSSSEVDDYDDGAECLSYSCLCVISSCAINTVVLTVFHFWNTQSIEACVQ